MDVPVSHLCCLFHCLPFLFPLNTSFLTKVARALNTSLNVSFLFSFWMPFYLGRNLWGRCKNSRWKLRLSDLKMQYSVAPQLFTARFGIWTASLAGLAQPSRGRGAGHLSMMASWASGQREKALQGKMVQGFPHSSAGCSGTSSLQRKEKQWASSFSVASKVLCQCHSSKGNSIILAYTVKFRITTDASEHKPIFFFPTADKSTLICFLYPFEEITVLSFKRVLKKGKLCVCL